MATNLSIDPELLEEALVQRLINFDTGGPVMCRYGWHGPQSVEERT